MIRPASSGRPCSFGGRRCAARAVLAAALLLGGAAARAEESPAPAPGAPAPAAAAPAPGGPVTLRYRLGGGATLRYAYRASSETVTTVRRDQEELKRDAWRAAVEIDYRLEAKEQVEGSFFELAGSIERLRRVWTFDGEENELEYALDADGVERLVRRFAGDDQSDAPGVAARKGYVRPVLERPVVQVKCNERGVVENAADPTLPPGFQPWQYGQLFHEFKLGELIDFGWCTVPEGPVKAGDTWTETLPLLAVTEDGTRMPGVALVCTYRVEGFEDEGRILRLSLSAAMAAAAAAEPDDDDHAHGERTSIAQLKKRARAAFPDAEGLAPPTVTYAGEVRFDLRVGLPQRQRLEITIRGLAERLAGFVATTDSTVRYEFTLVEAETVATVQERHDAEWLPAYPADARAQAAPGTWPVYRPAAAEIARVREIFLPAAARARRDEKRDRNNTDYLALTPEALRAKAAEVARGARAPGADFVQIAHRASTNMVKDAVHRVSAGAAPRAEKDYAWVARHLGVGQVSHPIAVADGWVILTRIDDPKPLQERVSVSHILVPTGAEAAPKPGDAPELAAIKRRYAALDDEARFVEAWRLCHEARREGADFRQMVLQYGTDPGMRAQEHYDVTADTGFVPEFKDVARRLEVGEVGDPVKSTFGYHIIKRVK